MNRRRLSSAAAGVLALYLVMWMLRLAFLESGPAAFDRTATWAGSTAGRLALAGVLSAAAYHALDGARQVVGQFLAPGSERMAGLPARATVRAGWWAVVLPGWVILLRPWLEGILL